MKKILSVITLIMVSLLTSCKKYGNTIDNLVFKDFKEDNQVIAYEIIGYTKKLPTNIILPEEFTTQEHGKLPIISIGEGAFKSSHIKRVVIPENIEYIQEEAFFNSLKLEVVQFEPSSRLKVIGDNAFKYNVSLKEIEIPKSVLKIGEFAFAESINLEKITFEENSLLKTIGKNAFSLTRKLKEITLPSKIEDVGANSFYGCLNLENINILNNANYSSLNGVLFNHDKSILIMYPSGKKDLSYEIISEVVVIDSFAFYENEYLETIILNNDLTIIKELALARVKNIKKLVIPKSVTTIEKDAFKGAESLVLYFLDTKLSDDFHKDWNSSELSFYLKPNWSYDSNNNPKPN